MPVFVLPPSPPSPNTHATPAVPLLVAQLVQPGNAKVASCTMRFCYMCAVCVGFGEWQQLGSALLWGTQALDLLKQETAGVFASLAYRCNVPIRLGVLASSSFMSPERTVGGTVSIWMGTQYY
jgi:hypothetical protein